MIGIVGKHSQDVLICSSKKKRFVAYALFEIWAANDIEPNSLEIQTYVKDVLVPTSGVTLLFCCEMTLHGTAAGSHEKGGKTCLPQKTSKKTCQWKYVI